MISKKRFEEVMPRYFSSSRFKSFQRNLNLWGFQHLREPHPERGNIANPLFVRGSQELCKQMTRIKNKGLYRRTRRVDEMSPISLCKVSDRTLLLACAASLSKTSGAETRKGASFPSTKNVLCGIIPSPVISSMTNSSHVSPFPSASDALASISNFTAREPMLRQIAIGQYTQVTNNRDELLRLASNAFAVVTTDNSAWKNGLFPFSTRVDIGQRSALSDVVLQFLQRGHGESYVGSAKSGITASMYLQQQRNPLSLALCDGPQRFLLP